MSPLNSFMTDLLGSHEGSIQLVVDNARMTINQTTISIPLPITNSSNHSSTRWECVEPSTKNIVQGQNNRRKLPPSLQQRRPSADVMYSSNIPACPPIRKVSNSVPACPIRKLSKESDDSDKSGGRQDFKYCPASAMAAKLPLQSSRPPLSPKKISARKKATASNKILVVRKLTANKKLSITTKALSPVTSIGQTKPYSPPPGSCLSPQAHLLSRKKLSETLEIPKQTGDYDPSSSASFLSPMEHLKIPGRSLSKTLGVDTAPEQAPKCPTRRPSTQPSYHSPAPSLKPSYGLGHLSEHSTDDSTAASTLSSSRPVAASSSGSHREIFVPPSSSTDEPPISPSTNSAPPAPAISKSRGMPIFFKRLTKGRIS